MGDFDGVREGRGDADADPAALGDTVSGGVAASTGTLAPALIVRPLEVALSPDWCRWAVITGSVGVAQPPSKAPASTFPLGVRERVAVGCAYCSVAAKEWPWADPGAVPVLMHGEPAASR